MDAKQYLKIAALCVAVSLLTIAIKNRVEIPLIDPGSTQ